MDTAAPNSNRLASRAVDIVQNGTENPQADAARALTDAFGILLDNATQRASAAIVAHPWLAQGRTVMDAWADSGAIQPVGHDREQHFHPQRISRQLRPATDPHQKKQSRLLAEGKTMKKPLLSIDEPEPKKATRADRPPVEGFATVVDGHFKSEFDTAEAAEAAGRKLKSAYPYLQIEIYDSAMKVRTLLT